MNNVKNYIFMILLLLVPMIVPATDSNVTFNYSGLVRVNGAPFDGTGEFKLAIVTNNGNFTLWSNDSTSTNGSEPTAPILSTVSDGIFSINVGDITEGMDPINRALFNNDTKKMRLRIWFSDGTNGFQSLLPQRKLDNIELLALTTGSSDLEIYVSETTGNDEFDGLTTDTAKATVQAGIDIIPSFIDSPVVVNILPGTYYEEVKLNSIRLTSSEGTLTIKGDESNMPVISGADTGTTTPVRDRVMTIASTDFFILENIHFDTALLDGVFVSEAQPRFINCVFSNFDDHCIKSLSGSNTTVFDSTFRDSRNGIRISGASRFGIFSNTIIQDIERFGVLSFGKSFFRADDSIIQNCGIGGITMREASLLTTKSTTVDYCGFSLLDDVYNIEFLEASSGKIYDCDITNGRYGGVKSSQGSFVMFIDNGLGTTTIDNCPVGVRAETASSAYDRTGSSVTIINTSTLAQSDSSSNLLSIP